MPLEERKPSEIDKKVDLYTEIYLNAGIWFWVLGLAIITVVSLWDVFMQGIRQLFHYAVCWKGIVLIWVGLILIGISRAIDRVTRR